MTAVLCGVGVVNRGVTPHPPYEDNSGLPCLLANGLHHDAGLHFYQTRLTMNQVLVYFAILGATSPVTFAVTVSNIQLSDSLFMKWVSGLTAQPV